MQERFQSTLIHFNTLTEYVMSSLPAKYSGKYIAVQFFQ